MKIEFEKSVNDLTEQEKKDRVLPNIKVTFEGCQCKKGNKCTAVNNKYVTVRCVHYKKPNICNSDN